ncbi:MAG: redoxin domain-containing protein [Bacteroidota bacterium]
MLTNRLFYFALCAILIACAGNRKESNTSTEFDTIDSMAMDESTALPYPVYDYESLEPLLNKKDDKTYIVNFWATWCKPCLEEMPYFQKTFEEQKNHGVELILVSLDMPSMWEKRLVPYVKEKELKGEVVILNDTKMNEWIPRIAENWGGGIPATLIYNKNGRSFYEKGFTYEELNTELEKFIP